jgi:hypothetical protein
VGGHLGCSVCMACQVVRVVFDCSVEPFLGAAQPYSHRRCLPLGSPPRAAHACVLCAYVSPLVDLCVGECPWVWLPVPLFWCPPTVFVSRRAPNAGRPSFTSWVSTSAGLLLSPVAARWCVLRSSVSVGFLSEKLVPSQCRIPCLPGVAYCRPVGLPACSPQCLRLAFV